GRPFGRVLFLRAFFGEVSDLELAQHFVRLLPARPTGAVGLPPRHDPPRDDHRGRAAREFGDAAACFAGEVGPVDVFFFFQFFLDDAGFAVEFLRIDVPGGLAFAVAPGAKPVPPTQPTHHPY